MSRDILTAVLFSLFNLATLSSQEQSEKFLFGGNLGFSYSKSHALVSNLIISDSKTVSTSASIIGGYFITPKIALGLSMEYNMSNTDFDHSMVAYYNSRNLFLSPFIRYYMISEFFGQAQMNIGNSYTNNKAYYADQVSQNLILVSTELNYFNLGFGLGLGCDIKMKSNMYLEPMIKYMSNKLNNTKNSNDFTQSAVYFNLGVIVKL